VRHLEALASSVTTKPMALCPYTEKYSMLPTTLNTNEVKNAAGTEVEFSRRRTAESLVEFAASTEVPSKPHRITVSQSEISEGTARRRRTLVRIDKSFAGEVDSTAIVKGSAYVVADLPVGAMNTTTEFANILAELLSLCASQGASTTILYDGTGYGAAACINGTL